MIVLVLLGIAGVVFFNRDAIGNSVGDAVEPYTDSWTKFDGMFRTNGTIYGVPWTWLKAICLNESDLGKAPSVARGLDYPGDVQGSKSSDGKSWGIMQMTLSTARGLDPSANEVLLNQPTYSVQLAAQYLAQLQRQFSMLDPRFQEWVIKSYNQGPGNTRKEISGATSGYAQEYWERFQRNLSRVEAG